MMTYHTTSLDHTDGILESVLSSVSGQGQTLEPPLRAALARDASSDLGMPSASPRATKGVCAGSHLAIDRREHGETLRRLHHSKFLVEALGSRETTCCCFVGLAFGCLRPWVVRPLSIEERSRRGEFQLYRMGGGSGAGECEPGFTSFSAGSSSGEDEQ